MSTSKTRVAILGATGYTAVESLLILARHPGVEVTMLTALPAECGHIAEVFPRLKGLYDLDVIPMEVDKLADAADVALCCLPHKVPMSVVPGLLAAGIKVVDFSADYRIRDLATYEKFYVEHTDAEHIGEAAFGLPELFRESIVGSRLVANPGCYPTGAALAVAPLLKDGLIAPGGIIFNSLTGASGAGRKPHLLFHFPEMNENVFAYGVGVHRHGPEIDQILSDVAGEPVTTLFQPHVGPFDRGILTSAYADPTGELTAEQVQKLYADFYADEPFVRVLDGPPHLKNVARTNYCDLYPTVAGGKVVIFSAIDNLIKGASGQAIQNLNIICGFEETTSLL